jgi:hypothetical protein
MFHEASVKSYRFAVEVQCAAHIETVLNSWLPYAGHQYVYEHSLIMHDVVPPD